MDRVTGAELARILGLSRSRITRLRQSGVLEADERGLFDVAEAVQAYIAFIRESVDNRGTIAAARTDYLAEQRRRLKLANDRATGEVIPTASVQWAIQRFATIVVQTVESWPGRCAGVVAGMSDPAEIRSHLHDEVRALRTQMADALTALAREEAGDEPGWSRIGGLER